MIRIILALFLILNFAPSGVGQSLPGFCSNPCLGCPPHSTAVFGCLSGVSSGGLAFNAKNVPMDWVLGFSYRGRTGGTNFAATFPVNVQAGIPGSAAVLQTHVWSCSGSPCAACSCNKAYGEVILSSANFEPGWITFGVAKTSGSYWDSIQVNLTGWSIDFEVLDFNVVDYQAYAGGTVQSYVTVRNNYALEYPCRVEVYMNDAPGAGASGSLVGAFQVTLPGGFDGSVDGQIPVTLSIPQGISGSKYFVAKVLPPPFFGVDSNPANSISQDDQVDFEPDMYFESAGISFIGDAAFTPPEDVELYFTFGNSGNTQMPAGSQVEVYVVDSPVAVGGELIDTLSLSGESAGPLSGGIVSQNYTITLEDDLPYVVGQPLWLYLRFNSVQGEADASNDSCTPVEIELIAEVDLVIHLPPAIDPQEGEVTQSNEATLGSITWLNIDNDDGDSLFDHDYLSPQSSDLDVSSVALGVLGDDDLIRATLRVRPSNPAMHAGHSLALTSNVLPDHIAVWEFPYKGIAYTLGDPIDVDLAKGFAENAGWLEKDLYVEGIVSHHDNVSPYTEVALAHSAAPFDSPLGASARVVVVGVEEVGVAPVDNGFSPPFHVSGGGGDACPNFSAAYPQEPSLRVFSGARGAMVDPANPGPRDSVQVWVRLSVNSPYALSLYLRSFDMDDPAGGVYTDPNDGGGGGQYEWTVDDPLFYTSEEDNRGHFAGVQRPAAGFLTLNGSPQTTQDADGILEVVIQGGIGGSSVGYAKLQVSQSPGDNYSVIASGDRGFIARLANTDAEDGINVVDPAIKDVAQGKPGTIQARSHHASAVVSVWRLLHIEYDGMDSPSGLDNSVSGYISQLLPNAQAVEVLFGFQDSAGVLLDISDGSYDLDGEPSPQGGVVKGDGRFQGGALTVAGGPTGIPIEGSLDFGVKTDTAVTPAPALVPIACMLTPNPASGSSAPISGSVTQILPVGAYYGVALSVSPVPQNWADFQGGSISMGTGAERTILAIYPTLGGILVDGLSIPFMLTDDDSPTLPAGNNHHQIDPYYIDSYLSNARDAYSKAYVYVEGGVAQALGYSRYDHSFKPHALASDAAFDVWLDTPAASIGPDFWLVHIIGGMQKLETADFDPNLDGSSGGEGGVLGSTVLEPVPPSTASFQNKKISCGGSRVVVYRESIRDVCDNGVFFGGAAVVPPAGLETRTVVHELSHCFGLDHYLVEPPFQLAVGTVLDEGGGVTTLMGLDDQQVHIIRSRIHEPGKP